MFTQFFPKYFLFLLLVFSVFFACRLEVFNEIQNSPQIIFPKAGQMIPSDSDLRIVIPSEAFLQGKIWLDGSLFHTFSQEEILGNLLILSLDNVSQGKHEIRAEIENNFQISRSQTIHFETSNLFSTHYLVSGKTKNKEIPVEAVDISIESLNGVFNESTLSSEEGVYQFWIPKDQGNFFELQAFHPSFEPLRFIRSLQGHLPELDLSLTGIQESNIIDASEMSLESITLTDSQNPFSTVSFEPQALRTINGDIPQAPVSIAFDFIDPQNVFDMPGLDMLSINGNTGVIQPLTTLGAINLNGIDANGDQVVMDSELVGEGTGIEAEFPIDNPGILDEPLVETWELNIGEGGFAWENEEVSVEDGEITCPSIELLNRTQELWRAIDPNIIIGLLESIVDDINANISEETCFTNYESYPVTAVRLSEIFVEYFRQRNKLSKNLKALLILGYIQQVPSEDNFTENAYENIRSKLIGYNSSLRNGYFDYQIVGEWDNTTISGPFCWQIDFSGIDLQFLQTIMDLYISCPSQVFLSPSNLNSMARSTIDLAVLEPTNLIPFNLDVPWQGVPLEISAKDETGDGEYKLVINGKGGQFGSFGQSYQVTQYKDEPFELNILVPELMRLHVEIYRKDELITTRILPPQDATDTYRWSPSSGKNGIETINGKEPNWHSLDTIYF